MNLSEAIVKIMKKEGITDIFGIPGASINGLYEVLDKEMDNSPYHHEARGMLCACSRRLFQGKRENGSRYMYIRAGATNFVTGIYTAGIDSIPLIAITGQGVRAQMGKDAFQCIDMVSIAKLIVKHTVCLDNPKTAVDEVINAFKVVKSGKPGPVIIDFPLDMQKLEVEFDEEAYVPAVVQNPKASLSAIKAAMDMLMEAKNPVILMGGGVILANANEELVKFAEVMQIPVVTTYMAKGGIPTNHPLNAGHPGIQVGQPIGNKIFAESDVVLAIGNRFTDSIPELQVSMKRKVDHDCVHIHPHRVFEELNKAFDDDTIFTTGCGRLRE